MIDAQGIAEYASILSAIGGKIFTVVSSLTNLESTGNSILIVGIIGFFFWVVVYKL